MANLFVWVDHFSVERDSIDVILDNAIQAAIDSGVVFNHQSVATLFAVGGVTRRHIG